MSTGASARHPCGPPVSGAKSKDGRAAAYTDVITVPSHTKKDNPSGLPSNTSAPSVTPASPYLLIPSGGRHHPLPAWWNDIDPPF